MKDPECVGFLQWALPHLGMRWHGFRRVRGQVCKRLQRRINQLELCDLPAYRRYLLSNTDEWKLLDQLCRISISRFYRDKAIFDELQTKLFPSVLRAVQLNKESEIRIWCAGAGGGEEPYTLALIWWLQFQTRFPSLKLHIVATDSDESQLRRAAHACYPYSGIKALPSSWIAEAFDDVDNCYCLQTRFRIGVDFRNEDLRRSSPAGRFHLVLCRNLAFTYFDDTLRMHICQQLHASLLPNGILIIGVHESLPDNAAPLFHLESNQKGVYRRQS